MLKMVDGVEVEMTPEEVDDLTNGSPPPPARKVAPARATPAGGF